MRKFVVFAVLAILALPVASLRAQEAPEQSPTAKQFIAVQQCDDVIKIMETIAKYTENPLFETQTITQNANNGQWYEGKSMMFVNWGTGTYSFVTLYPDGTACMQAIGKEFKPYEGPLLYADR